MATPTINGVAPTTEQLAALHTAAAMKAGFDDSPAPDRAALQASLSGGVISGPDAVLRGTNGLMLGLSVSASDVISGSGSPHGTTTDSGHTWTASGAGLGSTTINAGGWVEGTQNTYLFIDTGKKVHRYTQRYSGAMPTLAILKDSTLGEMLHVNYTSGGGIAANYWHAGVVSGWPTTFQQFATLPDLVSDGLPHDYTLEVNGTEFSCYVDGVLYATGSDALVPSFTGNFIMAQIHGAGEKIFGVTVYNRTDTATKDAEKPPEIAAPRVTTKRITSYTFALGNPAAATFSPISSSYFWCDSPNGHVFSSPSTTMLTIMAAATGYPAALRIRSYLGSAAETVIASNADGSGQISHQGSIRMKFPFNLGRVDLPSMRVLADGLPTSTSGLSAGELWVDTANGNIVKRV